MSKTRKAWSIRLKVIVLITALLGIMVAAAGYSYLESQEAIQVRKNTEDLTSYLLPIVGSLGNIEIHTLEQQLHLERAMELLLSGDEVSRRMIDRELEDFDRWGDRVRAEIEKVDQRLAEAVVMLEDEAHRLLVSRIGPLIDQLGSQHSSFETFFRDTFESARNASPQEIENHRANLRSEQKKLDQLLDSILTDIEGLQGEIAGEVDQEDHVLSQRSEQIVALALAALALGVSLALLITRRLVKPIEALKRGTERVASGDLDAKVEVRAMDELGQLASSFNSMVGGLREREHLQETFGRYIDPRIVPYLLKSEESGEMAERRIMTAFFSDIRDFTSIAERLTPDVLVRLTNAYLSDLSVPIQEQEGVIDKFIGDCIMAFWGPPFVADEDQASKACQAALASLRALPAFQKQVAELTGLAKDPPHFDVRIGIATGPMIVGSIGSQHSKNYTVLGDSVNLASRLEGACKVYSIRCLVSEETRTRVNSGILFREIDLLQVKGKSEPIRVYEPLLDPPKDAGVATFCRQFEEGLSSYRKRDWASAETQFNACLSRAPDDGPSRVFLQRIRYLRDNPPPPDWDAAWRLETK